MPVITTVSTWRCKCGIDVKVIGETDQSKPIEKRTAKCPKCGDPQIVYVNTILSVTENNPRVR